MAASKVHPDLPTSAGDVIKLAQDIQAKHTALAAGSPLGPIKWADVTPAIATADQKHKDSKSLAAQAETATEARDNVMPVVNGFIRDSRDILSVVYKDEPRRLADFGFTVTAGGGSAPKNPPGPPPRAA